MQNLNRALALTVALSSLVFASSAAAAGTRTINFDDVTAPCNFTLTAPLTTQYQAQGVTFAGPAAGEGGAILNQCSGFGVTGHSVPNFLAFNTGSGYPKGPETVALATPAYSVAINVGDGVNPGVATLSAYDGTTLVAESSRVETTAMQTMTVRATRITSVRLAFAGTTSIFDDLVWASAPISAADTYQTTRSTSLSVAAPGILGNDSDPNSDPLTAVLTRPTSNGTVVLSANGAFGYIPRAGFTGTDTFDYVASDGEGTSAEATATINVVAPVVQCVVPRVVGLRLAAARTRIRAANCAVGRTRYARSRKVGRVGRVLSQTPRPGTRLPRGTKVNLVVGRR